MHYLSIFRYVHGPQGSVLRGKYCHVEDSPTFSDHSRTFPQITWYSKPLPSRLRTFIGLRNTFRISILSLMFLPNYFCATKLYLSVLWLLYYYSSFLWLTIITIVLIVLDSIILVITTILSYELLFRYLRTLVYNPASLMAGTPVCNRIKQESDPLSALPQSFIILSPFSELSEIRDTRFLGEGATHKLKPRPFWLPSTIPQFPHFGISASLRFWQFVWMDSNADGRMQCPINPPPLYDRCPPGAYWEDMPCLSWRHHYLVANNWRTYIECRQGFRSSQEG